MLGEGPAWDVVRTAARRAEVKVVPLERLEDGDRVRSVIDAVWGEQVLPRELVKAFQHAGSILYGAEAEDRLVGFVMGFAGLADGLHVHSHMLASLPGWEDRGVGYSLKLAQRAACLDHGIAEARWTFDPLVARNARFNLVKLGAVAFRMHSNFYGEMADRLNRGDRSDRFEVRWRLDSERVEHAVAGTVTAPPEGGAVLEAVGDPPEPKPTGLAPVPGITVAVPRDHLALKGAHPELAGRWRDASAEMFRVCFDAGLQATWFDRDRGYVFTEPA